MLPEMLGFPDTARRRGLRYGDRRQSAKLAVVLWEPDPGLAFAPNGLSSLWRVFTCKQPRATARLREIGADDGPTREILGSEVYLYIRLQKGESSNKLFGLKKRGGETK